MFPINLESKIFILYAREIRVSLNGWNSGRSFRERTECFHRDLVSVTRRDQRPESTEPSFSKTSSESGVCDGTRNDTNRTKTRANPSIHPFIYPSIEEQSMKSSCDCYLARNYNMITDLLVRFIRARITAGDKVANVQLAGM